MLWWLLVPAVLMVLAGTGAHAVSRAYRPPQVPHRRDPQAFGIPFEPIRFPTAGGKTLYGWWIPTTVRPPERAATLILVHGWSRNAERMMFCIRKFHPAGFNLLAFDARGHGSSDADGTSNMLKFSEDIRAAIDEAVHRGANTDRIGVFGHSVGGAASIHAAAHDPRIRALVTVGAFAHPGILMRADLRKKGIPRMLSRLILAYVEHNIGAKLDQIAPKAHLQTIDAPVLIVHGEQDEVVPVEHARRLRAVAGPNVTFLILPLRGHSDCSRDPAFWPAVFAHLDHLNR